MGSDLKDFAIFQSLVAVDLSSTIISLDNGLERATNTATGVQYRGQM